MAIKTANYTIIEEHRILTPDWKEKIIPAGTFVKPIHIYYLPDHIKKTNDYKYFVSATEQFVYCSYGIIVVPKHIIREL